MKNISDIVILQRLRNNIIEYLELCTEEKLRAYQHNVPIANVPAELIEQWASEFDIDGYVQGWYTHPTFTSEELQSALAFESMINYACANIPNNIYDINDVFKMPWWPVFKAQAQSTLAVFMKRGRLSDDIEESNK